MAKRWITFAAVAALFVPTVAMAAPIVLGPTQEQLVEGHTVFAILETFHNVTNQQESYAAAVAVLVREATTSTASARFPGVLWFNDQYLVNPEANDNLASRYRYPCGGAVMAVNAGAPDPRIVLANVGDSSETRDFLTGVDYGTDYALVNVTTDPSVSSDTLTTSQLNGFDYVHSYMIHDPNDHAWKIDKYKQYRRSPPAAAGSSVVYEGFVWVVNIGGGFAFVPDDGDANCAPYEDFVSQYVPQFGQTLDDAVAPHYNANVGSRFLQDDTPPKGYDEPSRNGYCYNGNPAPCSTTGTTEPVRLYNALLYFHLADLTEAGAARDHSSPTTSTDTNGCQVGTEWSCPAGSDDNEGNSHPFHPTPTGRAGGNPPHAEAGSTCPAAFTATNPTNHGGSTTTNTCDYMHATRNVDIYFSGSGRPAPPVLTQWGSPNEGLLVNPLTGSGAPFHDYHSAYESTTTTP